MRKKKIMYEKICQEELDRMIESHKKFLTNDANGRCIFVSMIDFSGLDFKKEDLSLALFDCCVNLDLNDCHLSRTEFMNMSFDSINLKNTTLNKCEFLNCTITLLNKKNLLLDETQTHKNNIILYLLKNISIKSFKK